MIKEDDLPSKRLKKDETDAQPDSHVRTFLEEVFKKSRPSPKNILKVDASIQTDSDELGVNNEDIRQWDTFVSANLYPEYYVNNYSDTSHFEEPIISQDKIRALMSKWIHQYESWFKSNFGFDINGMEDQKCSESSSSENLETTSSSSLTTKSIASLSKSILDNVSQKSLSPSLEKEVVSSPVVYKSSESYDKLPDEVSFPGLKQILNSYIFSDPFIKLVQANYKSGSSPSYIHGNLQNPSPTNSEPCMINSDFSGIFTMHSLTSGESKYRAEVEEAQISAMLAAALMVCNDQSPPVESEARWGPHLKYCTYGRLNKNRKNFSLFKKNNDPINEAIEASLNFTSQPNDENSPKRWMPPAPPTLVLLKKQSLVCTLHDVIKERLNELKRKEKALLKKCDNGLMISLLSLDWADELERICLEHAFLKPVYIFRKVSTLPTTELNYYLSYKPNGVSESTLLQTEQVICRQKLEEDDVETSCLAIYPPTTDTYDNVRNMTVCDLIIGTIFIGQTLADDRCQARTCAAKMAMHKLAASNFLVGSVRSWNRVDFLSACLSPSADLVPCLPPFLYDPTKSLPNEVYMVDIKVDPISGEPEANFVISNPKSIDELWFYIADDYSLDNLDNYIGLERILAQSCLFSQIKITFEMEVDTNLAIFLCYALVDNCKRISCGVGTNAAQARGQALVNLFFKLIKTQPVVCLNKEAILSEYYKDSKLFPLSQVRNLSLLWGLTPEGIMRNLMWAIDGESERPIFLNQMSDESQTERNLQADNFEKILMNLQNYAASAIVSPTIVTPDIIPQVNWPRLEEEARSWLLLSCVANDSQVIKDLNINHSEYLLICKQKPLPRLKATLLLKGSCGDFVMLSKGNLSENTLKRIMEFEMFIDDVIEEKTPEPITVEVKADPEEFLEKQNSEPLDCFISMTELNSKNNPHEILDDLPKHLIPGIDF